MKTLKNIFDSIASFENLCLAFKGAKKGKAYKKYVLLFNLKKEKNLLRIQKELTEGTYKHGAYRKFIVNDSKKREIKAAPFRDRVVHHAIHNVIETLFDKSFIFDSYACRKGKGTHRAIKRLQSFLRIMESAKVAGGG